MLRIMRFFAATGNDLGYGDFAETPGKFYKILLQILFIRAIMLRVSGQGALFQDWDVAKR